MTQSALVGATNRNNSIATGTYYGPFGSTGLPYAGTTTEANAQINWPGTATIKNLAVTVSANSLSTASTFAFRKGGSSALLATAPSATTGTFTDTTNTASLAVGDLVNFMAAGNVAATGTVTPGSMTVQSDTSGQAFTQFGAGCFDGETDNRVTGPSVTRYFSFANSAYAETVELNFALYAMESVTLSRMQVYIDSNTSSSAATAVLRKNGATGNQTLSITAGTTGSFIDTTNTDSLASGDRFNMMVTSGASSTRVSVFSTSITYTGSTSGQVAAYCDNGTNSVSNSNYYHGLWGFPCSLTSEGPVQSAMPFAGTASNLTFRMATNSRGSATTLTFRKNGAAGNMVATAPASTTGVFTDTSHTDSFSVGDLINTNLQGGPTQVMGMQGILIAAAAGANNGVVSITLGAMTTGGAGTVLDTGAASITLGAMTLAATGTNLDHGQAAITLGALSLSSAGQVVDKAVLAVTLGALTLSATGVAQNTATAAITLGGLGLVSAGTVLDHAAAAISLGALTLSGAGTVSLSGASTIALASISQLATGTVANTGSAAISLGPISLAATATLVISGALSQSLGALGLASTGVNLGPLTGVFAATLDGVTVLAVATVRGFVPILPTTATWLPASPDSGGWTVVPPDTTTWN